MNQDYKVGDTIIITNQEAAEEAGPSFLECYKLGIPLKIYFIDRNVEASYPYQVSYGGSNTSFNDDEITFYQEPEDETFIQSLYAQ